MTDLRANAADANRLDLNLTGPLDHETVVQLAGLWLPQICFHEKERFHPIDLERLFKVPVEVLAAMPPDERISLMIAGYGPSGLELFAPPVVKKGFSVLLHGGLIDPDLDASPDGTERLLDGVDTETRYSHGASLSRSRTFFGASDTVSGNTVPQPGDPRVPAHDIVVRAEMRFLLDALRHQLQDDRPADALWGRFAVENLLVDTGPIPLPAPDPARVRAALRKLVAGYQAENEAQQLEARQDIAQLGGTLDERAWDAIRFYAFLEFYFVYAYNDYTAYGTWPFENEHEGDVEGCCVVFDRRELEGKPVDQVVAHTVITSVHEEFNDNDELKKLPAQRNLALEELIVYVAPGSHATYLSAGAHDVTDWEDILTDWPGELSTFWQAVVVMFWPAALPFLLLAAITEHFVDSEDETTDDGVRVGPPDPADPVGGTKFDHELVVTPLSHIKSDVNLYQAGFDPPPDGLEPGELARRAFPGNWGGHRGTRDHSSPWEPKTERYFRKFLADGEITGEMIQ